MLQSAIAMNYCTWMTNLYEYGPTCLTDGLPPFLTSLGFVKLNMKYCMYTCDDGDFQFLKVSEPSFSSTFCKNVAKQVRENTSQDACKDVQVS